MPEDIDLPVFIHYLDSYHNLNNVVSVVEDGPDFIRVTLVDNSFFSLPRESEIFNKFTKWLDDNTIISA